MMFRIGQKVERVGGKDKPEDLGRTPPLHVTVTVSNVYTAANGISMIEIAEFPFPDSDRNYAGFCANYFRPVVEKSTDAGMAILKEILERETVKDRAPVASYQRDIHTANLLSQLEIYRASRDAMKNR